MKSKEDVLNDVSYRLYNCSFMFAKDQRTSDEVLAIYDIAMEEYAQQFASQPPAQGYADSVEFEDYMGSERDNFVNEINNQKWDTKMRTAAESLLICFDQMANRLAGYSAHPPAPAGMEEAVRGINEELVNLISDDQINAAWGNANFGDASKRDVIKDALLQIAGDFRTGHTAECILTELGLITSKRALTKKGKRYLFYSFHPKAASTPPAKEQTSKLPGVDNTQVKPSDPQMVKEVL